MLPWRTLPCSRTQRPRRRLRQRTPRTDLRRPLALSPSRREKGEAASAAQGDALQYATGVGSSERHMYHVATLRQGAQASATSRASLRLTGSPEK